MKLVRNTGSDRVVDLIRPALVSGRRLDVVTPHLSLFACADLLPDLARVQSCRVVLPSDSTDLQLLGSSRDRPARNQLHTRWLAARLAQWFADRADVRCANGSVPQGAFVVRDGADQAFQALLGSLALSSAGLGLTQGNPLSLIQASETPEEARLLSEWLDAQWNELPEDPHAKASLIETLQQIASHREPHLVHAFLLHHLFRHRGDELDEDQIVKSATGIRNTVVWKKLFKFQRDGVVGAIDKLNRYGGCIIADSVGLGKTFEALAIIKYHELRNERIVDSIPGVESGTPARGRCVTSAVTLETIWS